MASAYLAEYRDLDISAVITLRSGVQITVDADDIYSYSVSGTAAATGIPIGEAISNSFSMGVSAAACPYTAEELDSAEVRVRIGVRNSSSVGYKYTDAGAWYVTQAGIPEGASSITLKGADALSLWFDAKYEDSEANYPAGLLGLLQTVAGLGGVTVSSRKWLHSDAALNAMPKWAEGTTLRDIVGYIAGCAGGFAQINMSGELEIITNGWGDVLQLDTATYNTYTPTGGAKFRLNCLRVAFPINDEDAEEPEVVRFVVNKNVEDNASNCVELSGNPLMTEAMAQAVVNELSKYEYHGCDVLWLGDPAVNCGHVLEITPLDGVKKVGLVNNRQLTFDGGLSGQISSTMPTLHDTSTHYSSSGSVFNPDGSISVSKIQGLPGGVINAMLGKFDRIIAGDITADKFFAQMGKVVLLEVQQFEANSIDADIIKAGSVTAEKLAAGSVTANKLAADSVTADKIAAGAVEADAIKAGAVTTGKIAAGSVTTNKLAANSVTTDKVAAGAITAKKIAAKTITADSGIIDDSAIGTAQIADGSITEAKIVSLNADSITTGTLSVDRLLIAGDDGLIYKINATSSGLSMSELSADQYKNYINGTVIVAKSITAAQIAAETITGNEILSGSITAKQIDVSELFANQATIDALNTVDIRGNGSLKLLVDSLYTIKVFDGQLAQAECLEGQTVRVCSTFEHVQAGIGEPSPDNIRPITGRTGAELVRCGKNLLDFKSVTKNGISFTLRDDGGIHIKGSDTTGGMFLCTTPINRVFSGTFSFSMGNSKVVGADLQMRLLESHNAQVSSVATNIQAATAYAKTTFTLDNQYVYGWAIRVGTGIEYDTVIYPQLELGTTATEYEPYQGETYEVEFGETVYGGTLDWAAGRLKADRGLYTFTGTEGIAQHTNGAGRFVYYGLVSKIESFSNAAMVADIACSHYKSATANDLYATPDAYFTAQHNGTEVWFSDTGFDSEDDFKAWLAEQYAAGTPVQVCYKLAEPVVLELQPQIPACAEGLNTVYTDLEDGRIEFGHDSLAEALQSQINLLPGKIELAVTESKRYTDQREEHLQSQIDLVPSKISLAVTEVKEYADTAQSTANTANSKADAAQSTANANASNISELTSRVSQAELKITPDAITATVQERLELGGENLIAHTNDGVTGWGWTMGTGGKTLAEINEGGVRGCEFVRDSVAQSSWSVIYHDGLLAEQLEPDTEYTLTVDVKASVSARIRSDLRDTTGLNQIGVRTQSVQEETAANQWVRCEWRMKTIADFSGITVGNQVAYFTPGDSSPGVSWAFRNLKLERGNIATAWSPAAEELYIGSSIELSKNRIKMMSEQTLIAIPKAGSADGEEIVLIDEDGLRTTELTADEIHSDSVVGTVSGGSYTPANAGEMQAILDRLKNRRLISNVHIQAANVTGGSFTATGISGGQLYIYGGTINKLNLIYCATPVTVLETTFSNSEIALQLRYAKAELKRCIINAGIGIDAAYPGSDVIIESCTGTCSTLAYVQAGAVMSAFGSSVPVGNVTATNGGEIYSTLEFTAAASAPSTTTVTTATLTASTARTWGGDWLSTSTFGTAMYQGATGGGTLRRGCMWFPTTAISGKTIVSATLTLKRVSGIGGGGAVTVGIYGTTATGASGTPAIGTKYAEISLANGATGSVDVTAAVQALANGTIKGLMIYDGRTGTFDGKTYTYGYCKVYGTGSGAPTLNVTYK